MRALVFDLEALTDIDCDGHREAFNAAFAAHGLDIHWSKTRYRRLLALKDERQRVTAELRRRGISTECDVLCEVLADEICATAAELFEEMVLDADLSPRPGLVDLVMDAYAAGVEIAVVTGGRRNWSEPLVRQLVGEGLVGTVVTADDVDDSGAGSGPEAYRLALWELGVSAENTLVITGSAAGVRDATAAGLATAGTQPQTVAECQRLHDSWWAGHRSSAA